MAKKKQDEEEQDDQVYTARVSDLEMYSVVMALTPIVDPEINQHPSDPDCKWGVGINFVGLNATRKSSLARSVGRRTGLGVWIVNAPTKRPDDFGGVVVPTANGIALECILPPARHCMAAGGGIILIDEISDALPAVQAASHTIPVEGYVGDHPLPKRARTWMAMNPIEYATVGHGIGSGLGSRYAHVWVDPPTRHQWVNWLQGNLNQLIRADVWEAKVIQEWNKHWPETVSLASAYMLSTDDSTLHDQPKPDDPRSGGPWANPRAWHWFCCARTAMRCLDAPSTLELEIMETLMGRGVTATWAAWVANADLPNVNRVLKGDWKIDTTRPDRTNMIITQLCEHVRGQEKADRQEAMKTAMGAWAQVLRLVQDGLGDIAVKPAKLLALSNLSIDCDNADVVNLATNVIDKMTDAGFTPFGA